MTLRRANPQRRFTPEVLLSAPSLSAGIPNEDGTLIAYTESSYSFELHSSSKELFVFNVATGDTSAIAADIGDFQWLEGSRLVWLQTKTSNSYTTVVVGDAVAREIPHTVGQIFGQVSSLKVTRLDELTWGIAVSGKADEDGSLPLPFEREKPRSSARIYTSLFVRHWDQYVTKEKNSIFVGTLRNIASPDTSACYTLGKFTNVLHAIGVPGLESPIPTFGGADHFDISPKGVVFISKDPELNDALHTKCKLYYVPFSSWRAPGTLVPVPMKAASLDLGVLEGALSSPVLSPDSSTLAFLAMRQDGYESDKNRIIVVPEIFSSETPKPIELFASEDGKGAWDRSPSSISWGEDSSTLLIKAEDAGTVRLFTLKASDSKTLGAASTSDIEKVPHGGSVGGFAAKAGKLFLTTTSLVNNGQISVLNLSDASEVSFAPGLEKATRESFGLSASQIGSIWYKGANEHPVHAWVVKPSNFEEGKKYPLCFLVHGGPQGAWNNSWSTRWNAAIFAEQGYVVVAPNPTGSTGYGQQFTDNIKESWGGLPYEDLVKGFQYIEDNLPYVDTERAVGLGASYGGFMMNWIQGHDLGRKFKALVTHDGIFSTKFALATEELYFPCHDLGGPYWKNKETWEKWDPSNHLDKWQTPHLIIHGEQDFRLSIAEGLAAFNVLQMRGVESKFLMFPDENHWVLKAENSLVWHRTVINWINKFAGLPALSDEKDPCEI